jgi:hypothetical protein
VPAVKTALPALTGLVIAYQVNTYRGWLCRNCGLAIYRKQTVRTLVRGWWSLTGLAVVPMFLLIYLIQWVRLTRLPAPRPSPGVRGPNPGPADPGRPVFRRPVALMLLLALPAVVVFGLCSWFALTA